LVRSTMRDNVCVILHAPMQKIFHPGPRGIIL
jgi:hypothetical protein